jgi:hypothetical protein
MKIREAILNCDDTPELTPVPIPEWGYETGVFIKVMSGSERDSYECSSIIMKNGEPDINRVDGRARLLVLTLCDENGKNIFVKSDVAKLGTKCSLVMDRLMTIAAKVNKLSASSQDESEKN